MITWDDFIKIDFRAGTVIKTEPFEGLKKPAIKVWVDLGPDLGVKKSSAQITKWSVWSIFHLSKLPISSQRYW
jgi:tRNA-binding protein